MFIRTCAGTLFFTIVTAASASAQNFTFDARKIGLGGVGGDLDNVAAQMIDEQRPYGSIVLPFGLIQLIHDWKHVKPGQDNFDPVRAFEYAASPIHFLASRGSGDIGNTFIYDLVNGRISEDLSSYNGFSLAESLSAEGLAAPTWGKTIKIVERGGTFHGIFVGAGPYLAVRTTLSVDSHLRDILAGTITQLPNASLRLNNNSEGQLAAAITGGYRGRFVLPFTGSGERDGLYVGVNYHHLRGFQYHGTDSRVRFDTNSLGFVINPVTGSVDVQLPENPVVLNYRSSRSGNGLAVDAGVGAVVNRWEVGFGASGIANRINWTDLELTRYSQSSIVNAGGFIEQSIPLSVTTLRTKLPVSYSGNVAYHADGWSALGDVVRGFNGTTMHLGYERPVRAMELRGGSRYSRSRWHPSAGAGFNLSPRVGLDVAAFTTTANIQRKQKLGVAVSLRLNRDRSVGRGD